MIRRYSLLIAATMAFTAIGLLSCTKKPEGGLAPVANNNNNIVSPMNEKIILGHYASLTGEVANFGQATKKGVDLAMEQYNAKGGYNGKKVEVITYDDQGKPEEAASTITKLITQDKVLAVIGEVASSLSIVAADVAMRFKTPMISPSSTNPTVTQKGEYIFRICFIDPFQGKVMAKFAGENLKAKTAAVFRDLKQDYSVGLANFFTEAFEKQGGKVVLDTSYQSKDTDFKAQLTEIKAKNPDIIFLPGYYNDVALIMKQGRQLGLKQPFLGGDGWESEDLVKVAGKAAEGSYYSNHYALDTKDPSAQDFIKSFKARYNGETPDAMAALGFDAFNVMMDALKRAKTQDKEGLRAAIAETTNFPAVTGSITLDSFRNAVKSAVVLKVENGKPHFFSTVNP